MTTTNQRVFEFGEALKEFLADRRDGEKIERVYLYSMKYHSKEDDTGKHGIDVTFGDGIHLDVRVDGN